MSVETILQDIDREIAGLTQARSLLTGLGNHSNGPRAAAPLTGRTSRFSDAARRKMAAAQKRRWAAFHAAKGQSTGSKPAKATRVISISARRKMAAAQKARWNAFRAGKARRQHREATCIPSSKGQESCPL